MTGVTRRTYRLLDENTAVWFAAAVLVPGLAYAAGQVWIGGEAVADALLLGAVFGVVFAGVSLVGRRLLGR